MPSIKTPSGGHARAKSGGGGARGSASGNGAAALDKRLLVLRLLACAVVLYGELFMFTREIGSCSWPDEFGFDLLRTGSKPFKLLLVADPQILDLRSHPEHNIVSRYWTMWHTDNYARKAWRLVLKKHRPDAVFFLGDLLDSGVEVTDRDEHSHYVHRFQNIFTPIPRTLPMHHVPGNHDLGLHLSPGGSAYSRERYTETFGPLNGQVELGNHTIAWIDAPGFLEEYAQAGEKIATQGFRPTNGGVIEFLQGFKKSGRKLPRLLLSHIPLFRPEGTPCGPLREHRQGLHEGRGKNFQNEIDQAASKFLLEAVDPAIVFSGDNHDYCHITHHLALSSPQEITLKSFRIGQSVRKPGYQLVSLLNPLMAHPETMAGSSEHLNRLCLLPDQSAIYYGTYFPFSLLLLAVLAAPRIYSNFYTRRGTSARSNGLPLHTSLLSRILRRRSARTADDEDEYDNTVVSDDEEDESTAAYNTSYPISPAVANYSYHSPTDDDYVNIATPLEIVPRQGKNRVRRVSRVWLWDPKTADEEYLRFLKRLGPIYRWLIRPLERSSRRIFHRLYGRRLQILTRKLNSGNVLEETIQDFGRVALAGVAMYIAVWIWFTW